MEISDIGSWNPYLKSSYVKNPLVSTFLKALSKMELSKSLKFTKSSLDNSKSIFSDLKLIAFWGRCPMFSISVNPPEATTALCSMLNYALLRSTYIELVIEASK